MIFFIIIFLILIYISSLIFALNSFYDILFLFFIYSKWFSQLFYFMIFLIIRQTFPILSTCCLGGVSKTTERFYARHLDDRSPIRTAEKQTRNWIFLEPFGIQFLINTRFWHMLVCSVQFLWVFPFSPNFESKIAEISPT